jgi:hypothetical protein
LGQWLAERGVRVTEGDGSHETKPLIRELLVANCSSRTSGEGKCDKVDFRVQFPSIGRKRLSLQPESSEGHEVRGSRPTWMRKNMPDRW